MGFFSSTRTVQESAFTGNTTLESLLEDSSVYPARQVDLIEASMEMLIDIEENHNIFFKYIGANELAAIEESGEEFVYTEGVLDSIINTIKSFLSKIWEKIKALFKRFMMTIDSYTKNDKEFCNKYRKEIFSKSIDSDFTFKGYKWKIEDKVIKLMEDMGTAAMDSLSEFNKGTWQKKSTDETQKSLENLEDYLEKKRGDCLKALGISSNSATLEEFRKELHEYFRGGDTEKQELDSNDQDADPNHCFTELMNSADTKKKAQNAFKANKKNIDNTEKEFLRIQKEHIRDLPNEKNPNGSVHDPNRDSTFTHPDDINLDHLDRGAIRRDYDNWFHSLPGNANKPVTVTVQNNVENADQRNDEHVRVMLIAMGKGDKYYQYNTDPNYRTKNVNIPGTTTKKDMNSRKSKALGIALKFINADKQCLITLDSEFLNALKERSRQYKALLIAVVHYKSNNESVQEGVYLEEARSRYTRSSFFSGLGLR